MARRISRPIGLYILTILLVLGAGIAPLIATLNAINSAEGDISFTLVFVSFFLAMFSLAAAIWAFVGHNEGRIAVLIFVSLNFLWWTFLSIMSIANSDNEALSGAMFLVGMIRPTVFFGIFWWYLTRKDVVAYFKQASERL